MGGNDCTENGTNKHQYKASLDQMQLLTNQELNCVLKNKTICSVNMNLRKRHSPNERVPASLETQMHVLSKVEVRRLLPAINSSKYVAVDAIEEGIKASDWGVKFTAGDSRGVHPTVMNTAKTMIHRNTYLRKHATFGEPVLLRVSVIEMGGKGIKQNRTSFGPQHHWHKDGVTPLITMVYVLYDGEWDSTNSPGAFEYGGRVALADRPCGNAYFESRGEHHHSRVRGGRSCCYYPATNSIYIIPGFVDHSIHRLEDANVVRHAIVVFMKPREQYRFRSLQLPVDEYLRTTWAMGFNTDGKFAICGKCYKVFKNKRQLYDHGRRVVNCNVTMKKKRESEK
jgi:hypothetical protein